MSTEYKSWDDMTMLECLAAEYWDAYKEAYNFRPRGIDTTSWTEEDFRKALNALYEIAKTNADQRQLVQNLAAEVFELRVTAMIQAGAQDRATALRWIHEADGAGGDDEYLCYLNDLPYGYFNC